MSARKWHTDPTQLNCENHVIQKIFDIQCSSHHHSHGNFEVETFSNGIVSIKMCITFVDEK